MSNTSIFLLILTVLIKVLVILGLIFIWYTGFDSANSVFLVGGVLGLCGLAMLTGTIGILVIAYDLFTGNKEGDV